MPDLRRHAVHPWCWCPRQRPQDSAAGSRDAARVGHPSSKPVDTQHAAPERPRRRPDRPRTQPAMRNCQVAGVHPRSGRKARAGRHGEQGVRYRRQADHSAEPVPHKPPVATTQERLAMVRLATRPGPLAQVVPTQASPATGSRAGWGRTQARMPRSGWGRSNLATPCRSWSTRSPWGHIWCRRMDRTSSPRALKLHDKAQTTDVDLSARLWANPASPSRTLLPCLIKRNRQPASGAIAYGNRTSRSRNFASRSCMVPSCDDRSSSSASRDCRSVIPSRSLRCC